jgi:hypothetical protein
MGKPLSLFLSALDIFDEGEKSFFMTKPAFFPLLSDTDRTQAADSNLACSGELKIICHVIFISI